MGGRIPRGTRYLVFYFLNFGDTPSAFSVFVFLDFWWVPFRFLGYSYFLRCDLPAKGDCRRNLAANSCLPGMHRTQLAKKSARRSKCGACRVRPLIWLEFWKVRRRRADKAATAVETASRRYRSLRAPLAGLHRNRTIRKHVCTNGNSASKSAAIPTPDKSFILHPKTVDFGYLT